MITGLLAYLIAGFVGTCFTIGYWNSWDHGEDVGTAVLAVTLLTVLWLPLLAGIVVYKLGRKVSQILMEQERKNGA